MKQSTIYLRLQSPKVVQRVNESELFVGFSFEWFDLEIFLAGNRPFVQI